MGTRALILAFSCSIALAGAACGDDDDGDHDHDGDHDESPGTRDSGQTMGGSGGSAGKGGSGGSGGSSRPDSGSPNDAGHDTDGGDDAEMTFFVSSEGSMTGDLGGLAGADARCQRLAMAAGAGDRTWRAYLSAERTSESDETPVNARDRIGDGPWHNADGKLLAKDVAALHALPSGNADLFLDENGDKINGQWAGSPTPNEHDILTGSTAQGMVLADFTCDSWTSDSADTAAQVGHSDGLGPMMNPNAPYNSWSSSHANESCANTAPRGGAGHIYCFAID